MKSKVFHPNAHSLISERASTKFSMSKHENIVYTYLSLEPHNKPFLRIYTIANYKICIFRGLKRVSHNYVDMMISATQHVWIDKINF